MLTALGLIAGAVAGTVMIAFGLASTLDSGPQPFTTSTAALVTDSATMDDVHGIAAVTGPPTVQISARTGDPAGVFIRVGPAEAVDDYLSGVAFDEVTEVDSDPFDLTVITHPGGSTAAFPVEQDFWVVSATSGSQAELAWAIQDGNYRLVVMNADGSPAVVTQTQMQIELPRVFTVATGVLVGGASSRRSESPSSPPASDAGQPRRCRPPAARGSPRRGRPRSPDPGADVEDSRLRRGEPVGETTQPGRQLRDERLTGRAGHPAEINLEREVLPGPGQPPLGGRRSPPQRHRQPLRQPAADPVGQLGQRRHQLPPTWLAPDGHPQFGEDPAVLLGEVEGVRAQGAGDRGQGERGVGQLADATGHLIDPDGPASVDACVHGRTRSDSREVGARPDPGVQDGADRPAEEQTSSRGALSGRTSA
ncbi:hypothetical protein SAMN05660657_05335 [Geodermatophilus amargosae]|uniref:Uncharacterized protein n=1 Tax=Geodermatophilus amargosae TaxID=1296565 RepID=A0A1I7D5F0_9ACTN|nr:hypothetical protein [Geodermatophilus amargosae]SFU06920.1 hypothetical protein SAMN05660657_05335 [Geodermatophilus amargosae]